ncbi:MAG: PEP-CTERM sorting domain-containing protein [Planctomycetota bacterium]
MRSMTTLSSLVVALALAAAPAAASVVFSTHNTIHFDGLRVHHGDVVEYDGGGLSLLFAETTLGGKDVDALHLVADGSLIFSTHNSVRLGRTRFDAADLIRYNPLDGSTSLWFDGGRFGRRADIDALHVKSNGNLLLSTKTHGDLGGLRFGRGDIVEFSPATDSASIVLAGSAFGGNGDVDAIDMVGDDLLISTHARSTLFGMTFQRGDIIRVNPAAQTASMVLPESTFGRSATNIDALSGGSTVPEPATLGLLMLGGAWPLACRRRRG